MGADSNWGDLELLDHIVQAGTLSGAARALGVNQTTVSRRLAALERRIGMVLFDRIDGRLAPTPPVMTVRDRLRTMAEEAALSIALLKRVTAELTGRVRVTSVGFILARILAPKLNAFAQEHGHIVLDFTADDQMLSFENREADIAIRLGRTAEDETLMKSLGHIHFRLFRPAATTNNTDTTPRAVVRYDDNLAHVPEMLALDRARPTAAVALKSNRLDILIEAALALNAEVMLPEPLAYGDGRFEVVNDPAGYAERPVYLMRHPDRARAPDVNAVARWIETTVWSWSET